MGNGASRKTTALCLRWSGSTLHEGDPRGIVDADMNEIPIDAMVTVDHAKLSSRDVMSDGADASELLDIVWIGSPGFSR
jgi:hypothetical protein